MILSLHCWRWSAYADTGKPRHFKIADYETGLLMEPFRILGSDGQITEHPSIRRMLIGYQHRSELRVSDSPCEPGWGDGQGRSRWVAGRWPSNPEVLWGSAARRGGRVVSGLSLGPVALERNPITVYPAPRKTPSSIFPQSVPNARRTNSVEEPAFPGVLRSARLRDTIGSSLSQAREAHASEPMDLAVMTHRGDTRLRISVGCHARHPAPRWETLLWAGQCHGVHNCDLDRSRKDDCKIDCLAAYRNAGRVRRGRRPANRRFLIHFAAKVPAFFQPWSKSHALTQHLVECRSGL